MIDRSAEAGAGGVVIAGVLGGVGGVGRGAGRGKGGSSGGAVSLKKKKKESTGNPRSVLWKGARTRRNQAPIRTSKQQLLHCRMRTSIYDLTPQLQNNYARPGYGRPI